LIEIIPLWLVNVLSFTTIFSVMTAIGTTITPHDCLAQIRAPSRLILGLISVLVVVPALGIAIGTALGLSLGEKVGIALMAIAPGAPLALRRALVSGGHTGFAPTLQMTVALLAIPAVPAWVFVGNAVFGTKGFIDMGSVARQVVLAQVLPLLLGAIVRRVVPVTGVRIGAVMGRVGAILLIAAIVSQLVDLHYLILSARPWPVLAAAITTLGALASGHLLGGPSTEIRHAVAIAGALRNVGLALLIATINDTPPIVHVVIVSYAIAAALIVTAYILLRGKSGARRR